MILTPPIQIVFENENFVICDKPSFVLSTPDRHHSDRPCLGLLLQKELGLQIFPVHRLDYEVSGLVMYAKNARAHRESQGWFQYKKIQKKYLALTRTQDFSHWPENIDTDRRSIAPKIGEVFEWKVCLQRGKKRSYESSRGEWAETGAKIESYQAGILTWSLFPHTGKPHQLRFELSRHGFPILGDILYGASATLNSETWKFGGIALRALALDFKDVPERMGLPLQIVV